MQLFTVVDQTEISFFDGQVINFLFPEKKESMIEIEYFSKIHHDSTFYCSESARFRSVIDY